MMFGLSYNAAPDAGGDEPFTLMRRLQEVHAAAEQMAARLKGLAPLLANAANYAGADAQLQQEQDQVTLASLASSTVAAGNLAAATMSNLLADERVKTAWRYHRGPYDQAQLGDPTP